MKNTSDAASLLTVFAGLGALFLYGCWASAFVIVHLWTWFVIPVFGVAALTLPQAYGLALITGFMTYQHYSHYNKDEREWEEKAVEICLLLARPWLILLVGWACHHFFM
jgi:hypothetical protein